MFAQKLLFGHVMVVRTAEAEEGVGAGRKRKGTEGELDAAEVEGEEPPAKKVAIDADGEDGARRIAHDAADPSETAQPSSEGTEDLQFLISAWFDTTNAGSKKEKQSYLKIAEELEVSSSLYLEVAFHADIPQLEPAEILFLTDSVEEYDASTEAGLKAGLMMRPGNPRLKKSEDANRFNMMWTLQNAQPLKDVPVKKVDGGDELGS